jgi:hypothetical protein
MKRINLGVFEPVGHGSRPVLHAMCKRASGRSVAHHEGRDAHKEQPGTRSSRLRRYG